MTDPNFVIRHGVTISGATASLAADGDDQPGGAVRRPDHRATGTARRWPLPVRLLGIVCLCMLGWFLLMAPLFIAR